MHGERRLYCWLDGIYRWYGCQLHLHWCSGVHKCRCTLQPIRCACRLCFSQSHWNSQQIAITSGVSATYVMTCMWMAP
jgi:hypothetical protein